MGPDDAPPRSEAPEMSAAAMFASDEPQVVDPPLRPITAPNFSVNVRGQLPSEEDAQRLGTLVGGWVREFSRIFDLSKLDGVTVAEDYAQALAQLDRGRETSQTLTASSGSVVGVGMTPAVLRDGQLKSHIVLNANHVWAIQDAKHEGFQLAVHLVAHECAHVEVTAKFDEAFPGVLMQSHFMSVCERARSDVILACWDEYAATRLSAGYGEDPTRGYENTLIAQMGTARQEANEAIKAYRIDADLDKVYRAVYRTYANLLKYAAYYLGTLAGRGVGLAERIEFQSALAGHWFEPYFHRLDKACTAIAEQYGAWQDFSRFEAIANIADDLVADGGVVVRPLSDGQIYIDIPFTPQTMPDGHDITNG